MKRQLKLISPLLTSEESGEGNILDITITRDAQSTAAAKERVSALLEKLKNKNIE